MCLGFCLLLRRLAPARAKHICLGKCVRDQLWAYHFSFAAVCSDGRFDCCSHSMCSLQSEFIRLCDVARALAQMTSTHHSDINNFRGVMQKRMGMFDSQCRAKVIVPTICGCVVTGFRVIRQYLYTIMEIANLIYTI